MARSAFAVEVDAIQKDLRVPLADHGFQCRGRTFNRVTEDGLTQVVNIQMGASDPPGTTYVPGFTVNLHGLFTVNLGVHVPEVARYDGTGEITGWKQDTHCCVRARLGQVCPEATDIWWPTHHEPAVSADVLRRLEAHGLPFLDRFATREAILREWSGRSEILHLSSPPRIVMAIIQMEGGNPDEARRLLRSQARDGHRSHAEYVGELAQKLGIPLADVSSN